MKVINHYDYDFVFSTPTSSPGLYRWRPGAVDVEEIIAPGIVLDDVVVEDLLIPADDGVGLPCQLVRQRGSYGRVPTLLYAYGAFGTPVAPAYSALAAAVVTAGAAYVLAHPRGGGELGRDWWEAARFERKQRTYDDVYTVAEWLHRNGRTCLDGLALTGDSAGGLLSAVAVTQRPDLWGAVVARVPSTDLIANLDDRYGRMVLSLELADIDDPRAMADLVAISPYHLVAANAYPATLLLAGANDPRCPPWHSRKLIARMQEQQQGQAPVLLSVVTGAGHGLAGASGALDPVTQTVAFVMLSTGLVPGSS